MIEKPTNVDATLDSRRERRECLRKIQKMVLDLQITIQLVYLNGNPGNIKEWLEKINELAKERNCDKLGDTEAGGKSEATKLKERLNGTPITSKFTVFERGHLISSVEKISDLIDRVDNISDSIKALKKD